MHTIPYTPPALVISAQLVMLYTIIIVLKI